MCVKFVFIRAKTVLTSSRSGRRRQTKKKIKRLQLMIAKVDVFFDQNNLIIIQELDEYQDLIDNNREDICFLVELNGVNTGDRGNYYVDYNIR